MGQNRSIAARKRRRALTRSGDTGSFTRSQVALPGNKRPAQCLGCATREFSENILDYQVAQEQAPSDFSGYISGLNGDQMLLLQYGSGRHIGVVIIPAAETEAVLTKAIERATGYLADQAAEQAGWLAKVSEPDEAGPAETAGDEVAELRGEAAIADFMDRAEAATPDGDELGGEA